jgi:hypothetical protein
MEKQPFNALVNGLVLCMFGSVSASPPGPDPRLLSLVPPGAAIVAELTQGTPASYLALTRNNTTDLMDFLSISGVDPNRNIFRTILVAATGSEGPLSEHSLVASGQFDSSHIFKSAVENGATESEYLGMPVLIVPPLERDKDISRDFRWLAFLDSQISVFGTIPMVKEELGRYLARSPADLSLMGKLSRLRSTDQSWCVLTSAVYNREIARRLLEPLGANLGQPDPAYDGLILGFHFGRQVEIEYESIPDSGNSGESQPQTQPGFSQAPPEAPPKASYFFSNSQAVSHKVIRLSKKQYVDFIAREEKPELARVGQESSQSIRK